MYQRVIEMGGFEIPMKCNQCDKVVIRTFNLSWDEAGICPECMDKKTNEDIKFVDDTIYTIEVNPVDLYWMEVTRRYLS